MDKKKNSKIATIFPKLENGIFLPLFSLMVFLLNKINLVEWFKLGAIKIFSKSRKTSTKMLGNIAIDIFILLKYLFVFIVWVKYAGHFLIISFVIYLLFMNLFTYFYYHVWNQSGIFDIDRMRRRFLALMLSFVFSIFCFTYLTEVAFFNEFVWPENLDSYTALKNSFNNTFALGSIEPTSTLGEFINYAQKIHSFIFLSIILTTSVPKENNGG